MSITNGQILNLREDAVEAGDLDMVQVCNLALDNGPVTIRTAKGSHTGWPRAVAEWQAEHQGAAATIGGLDVDDIDFDYNNIDAALTALSALATAECERVITDAQAAE